MNCFSCPKFNGKILQSLINLTLHANSSRIKIGEKNSQFFTKRFMQYKFLQIIFFFVPLRGTNVKILTNNNFKYTKQLLFTHYKIARKSPNNPKNCQNKTSIGELNKRINFFNLFARKALAFEPSAKI